jgi:hypothetical protein
MARVARPQARKRQAPIRGQRAARARTPSESPALGLLKRTSSVVSQASSILEAEVAAGIVAAKQAEERVLRRQAAPRGEMAEVMRRFRTDAHELVDVLMNLVDAAAESFAVVSEGTGGPPQQGGAQPAEKPARKRARPR